MALVGGTKIPTDIPTPPLAFSTTVPIPNKLSSPSVSVPESTPGDRFRERVRHTLQQLVPLERVLG